MKKFKFSAFLGHCYIWSGISSMFAFFMTIYLFGFEYFAAGFIVTGLVFFLMGLSYIRNNHAWISDGFLYIKRMPLSRERRFRLSEVEITEAKYGILVSEPNSRLKDIIIKKSLSRDDYNEIRHLLLGQSVTSHAITSQH
jgi:hypothetical protein